MGWLDLLDIGIGAAQFHQIRKAREQLSRTEAGAAAEATRREVLEVLRNFVFGCAQDLKALESHTPSSPQPVYVVARAFERRFQEVGITPEIFPEFTDKEYVQQVQTKTRAAIQESRNRLSDSQIQQAEACFNAIVQMPLLNQAIEATQAVEQLQATEVEWKALGKRASKARQRKVLGILGLGGTFLFLAPLACVVASILGSVSDILGELGLLGVPAVLLGGLVGSILLITSGLKATPSDYQRLKTTRQKWQAKLMPRGTWQQVVALFGEHDSVGYRDIRTTREDLMRLVLGQVEGFDKFLPVGD
ncbi:MAG: hypothetical protein H8E47_02015 [Anaerolineales bacterium]|nr:hypothetical protein [Anaerolineales bacterium]